MKPPVIRLIQAKDNPAVKALVQNTLAEFGLMGEGYAGVDAELDDMFQAYANELSDYYVIEVNHQILGAGGYAPLIGTELGTVAELRKMYFHSSLRGQGLGTKLIELCISAAKAKGFRSMYLETVPAMKVAQALYLKNGFVQLDHRLGDSGHGNCDVCMMKTLHD